MGRRARTHLLAAAAVAVSTVASFAGDDSPVATAVIGGLDAPDFNGDGYADLAVGMPFVPVGGPLSGAGAVVVVHGHPTGPFRGPTQVVTPAIWPGEDDVSFDVFGVAIVWGDFDDDGYDDLAVAGHLENVEIGDVTLEDAGRVFVAYGSPGGLDGGARSPDSFDLGDVARSTAPQTSDWFGNALVVGDFNGDGVDDLAVGASRVEVDDVLDAGAVEVFAGSTTSGLVPFQSVLPSDPAIVDGPRERGEFGSELAAGDVNGDGVDDLAITSRSGGGTGNGRVSVVYGVLETGLVTGTPPPDAVFQPLALGALVPGQQLDGFGASLAIGDFNGDGFGDLAAGAPDLDLFDAGGTLRDDTGGVLVVSGSAGGLDPNGAPGRPAIQLIDQDSPIVASIVGLESGDQFGSGLAVGRFTGRPDVDDLAIAARTEGIGSEAAAGNVVVLAGAPGLPIGSGTPAPKSWNQDTNGAGDDGVLGASEQGDQFGKSMTAGDWNGDGRSDLLAGVPLEQTTSSIDFSAAGAINVIFGSPSGLQSSGVGPQADLFLAVGFEPLGTDFTDVFGPGGRDQQFGYALDGDMLEEDWLRIGRPPGTPPIIRAVTSNVDGQVLVRWDPPVDTGGEILSYSVTGPGDLISQFDSTTETSLALFADVPIDEEATYTVTIDGTTQSASGSVTPRGALRPLTPARLLETRDGPAFVTIDGRFEGVGRVSAGREVRLEVAGRGGVPDGAAAAMLNVAAVLPDAPGFVTAYPCDGDRPVASNLNHGAGEVVPNSVFAQLSPEGEVCLFTRAESDLIVDVTGYVPASGTSVGVRPARLFETRAGEDTVDGVGEPGVRVAAGGEARVQVAGRGGVPADARTVFVNATAVRPSAPGFLTLYPCDEDRPNASNVNYGTGDVVANAVMASLSPDGELCVFSRAETDLVIDLNGFIDAAASPYAFAPERFADTRLDGSADTIDGQVEATGRVQGGDVLVVDVAGRGSVPEAGTVAALLNVAVVRPVDRGFLTVYPCDEDRPTASNVNYTAGDVVANGVLAKLAANGSICVFSRADTDVIVDVTGAILGDPRIRD